MFYGSFTIWKPILKRFCSHHHITCSQISWSGFEFHCPICYDGQHWFTDAIKEKIYPIICWHCRTKLCQYFFNCTWNRTKDIHCFRAKKHKCRSWLFWRSVFTSPQKRIRIWMNFPRQLTKYKWNNWYYLLDFVKYFQTFLQCWMGMVEHAE